jgi:hypothetical protein
VLQRLAERVLLVAEGRVRAGAGDAHGVGRIGEVGAFVVLLSRDSQGPLEGLIGIESLGRPMGAFRCVSM